MNKGIACADLTTIIWLQVTGTSRIGKLLLRLAGPPKVIWRQATNTFRIGPKRLRLAMPPPAVLKKRPLLRLPPSEAVRPARIRRLLVHTCMDVGFCATISLSRCYHVFWSDFSALRKRHKFECRGRGIFCSSVTFKGLIGSRTSLLLNNPEKLQCFRRTGRQWVKTQLLTRLSFCPPVSKASKQWPQSQFLPRRRSLRRSLASWNMVPD